MAKGRPDARDFVGGDGGPDACSTYHDAPLGLAFQDVPAEGFSHVGKIYGFRAVGTHIRHLMTPLPELLHHFALQEKARVVSTDYQFHGRSSLNCCRASDRVIVRDALTA